MINTAAPTLFADIDGCMIAYPNGGGSRNELTPHCVEALRHVVAHVPGLQIVLTSQRRLTDDMREEIDLLWRDAGLPAFVSATENYSVGRAGIITRALTRGQEIASWREANPGIKRWAVMDDDIFGIADDLEGDRCVFCRPEVGLTPAGAERLIHILTNDAPEPIRPIHVPCSDADL